MKKSKKYQESAKKVEKNKRYDPVEALDLAKEANYSKFPGSINVEIILNLTDKQKKEAIRGSYVLPHSFGKTVKILAFADKGDLLESGADIIGGEELIPQVEKNEIVFDVVISTPAMMPKIARLGKVLGTKGLMPNPKNGTVTTDIKSTVEKFRKGMKNFKADESSKINGVIGKTDMETAKLTENFKAFMAAVFNEVKKFGTNPYKSISMTPTMGPKISIDTSKVK
jgi:large subunit ribosomal protein L1